MHLNLPPLATDLQPLEPPEFLAQGTGNDHWLLICARGRLVWRQFGQAPGSNHRRETRILQQLQGFSWAPELIQAWPDHGLLCRQHPGYHPQRSQLSSAARQQLLQLVTELWQQPCRHLEAQDYPALINDYWKKTGKAAQLQPLAERLYQKAAAWPDSLYLTHHDLHAGNLLLHKDAWTLLDWEYAAPGNPWIDAVSLDRWLQLTAREKNLLQQNLPPLPCNNPWDSMATWLEDLDKLWQAAI
ncbi:phosphotransferase [Marinospirillum perlucidum]|uniref:phosphotransferase n=1 Tax=Marinospirillum perlucidum TaxID=1982602 RepID=UPI000DF2C9AD|nr:phosphotransferase [Marinospirillum perlucidum]